MQIAQPFPANTETQMKQKHSGLGIASFVISIPTGIAILVLCVIAGVIEVTTPGGMDDKSAEAVVLGLSIFAFIFVDLFAVGLGIAGLIQRNRKKIFAILGMLLSLLTIVGVISLMVIGSQM